MTTMTVDVDDLGMLLRLWRVSADLSLDEVASRANERLPASMQISRELVRRYERNGFPAGGAEAWVLFAITTATGHRIGELPQDAIAEADILDALLKNR